MPIERSVGQPLVDKVDTRLSQLAARQWAILDIDDLRACGLTRQAVSKRVKSGRLLPVLPRRLRLRQSEGRARGAFLAAVKACGPDAVLSHFSAAAVWELVTWDHRDPEVTAPTLRRHKGIRCRRSRHVERVYRKGIPITTPARTLIDLSATLTYRALRRAVNEALNRKLIKPADLMTGNHRGAAKLRRILATAAPTRNDFEDIVLAIAIEYGLPKPDVNVPFGGYVPDFRWPAAARDRRGRRSTPRTAICWPAWTTRTAREASNPTAKSCSE